ncbi:MAG: hypothetical protein ACM3VZ_09075 [Acidobacteriota bacterium]
MTVKHKSAIPYGLRPLAALLIQVGCLSSAFGLSPAGAQALPTGIVATVGDPKVTTSGSTTASASTMLIEQSSQLALIQWRSFNIGADAVVRHVMTTPNPSALTIHRVFDPDKGPSRAVIEGQLLSDHRVFVVSPGGVLATRGAVIDAPSVVLSAHDLDPDLVRDGYAKLTGGRSIVLQDNPELRGTTVMPEGGHVQIDNGATLKAGPNGAVMLVGNQITQNGRISVGSQGSVVLAAVGQAEIDIGDSGFLTLTGVGPGPATGDMVRSVSVSGQIEAAGGDRAGDVRLLSEGDVTLYGGAAIEATGGAVNVSLQADTLGSGSGRVSLQGYDSADYYAALRSTTLAAPLATAPTTVVDVSIRTAGGAFSIGGGVDGGASGVRLSYAHIDTTSATGPAGQVSIRSRYTTYDDTHLSAAVQIDHSTVNAGGIDIAGFNVNDAGVRLDSSALVGVTSGVDIRGVSTGDLSPNSIGLDVGSAVEIHGGVGPLTLAGRGTEQGIRIQDLTLTTSGGAVRRITLAGQSTLSASAGIGMAPEGALPIRIHDQAGDTVASAADLVIGATAGSTAPRALDLGTGTLSPQFRLSGRANFRPLGVDTAGQITESLSTPIQIGAGAPGAATSFVVLPQWFNAGVNPTLPGTTVFGSRSHTGQIGAAAGVLDGAPTVTLQNQGAGSAGIIVGGSSVDGATIGTLSLLSAGNISQTGPIRADVLNVIAPASATVSLNDPGNRVGRLGIDGAPDSSVSGASVPAASSSTGIPGFRTDAEGADFETLAITRVINGDVAVDPRIAQIEEVKSFELPQAIEEQRSDVYVRDQFNKPQLCTSASVSATGLSDSVGVEPLTLEWAKLRRSPQLSSCSGVRVDSACSAF